LNYFGARYYDSDLGRWTSVDPLAHLRHGLSQYQYAQNNPLRLVDPSGMLDENANEDDKDKQNWFLKMWSYLGQLTSSNENEESQSGNHVVDSYEMKGIKKVAEVSEKAKQNVVEGIDKVHDAATTTSGAASGAALLTIYEPPLAASALVISKGADLVAASSSFANYLITGKNSYGNRAAVEVTTFGLGYAASNAVKVGKTLTPENVIYLRNTIGGGYGSFMYGIGLGL
jgi:uncharacterized protein RhaS with RHS repeats